ncbi:remorin-like [Musa acuminata AAA Group]|uniref:remorin-like n=1 Tax=Musa acuminata AAA Group TaxID=214697 RepID=UPI0031E369CB
MAEEKPAKVEEEGPSGAAPPQPEAVKDVEEEKTAIVPAPEEKPDDSKALVAVEKVEDSSTEKGSGSNDRDAALARVATEKRLSLIKAWEENEKVKAENKAIKKISSISAWEKSKKADVEAELKKKEEELEKKKAEYAEQVKNKLALIHKQAEEKRAIAEAKHGEEALKAEEKAAKYRATGLAPKKIFGFF